MKVEKKKQNPSIFWQFQIFRLRNLASSSQIFLSFLYVEIIIFMSKFDKILPPPKKKHCFHYYLFFHYAFFSGQKLELMILLILKFTKNQNWGFLTKIK
jgi:hypothetical protein